MWKYLSASSSASAKKPPARIKGIAVDLPFGWRSISGGDVLVRTYDSEEKEEQESSSATLASKKRKREGSVAIAAFDFDGCLCVGSTFRGRRAFAGGSNDLSLPGHLKWASVPETLRKLSKEGCQVVVFTNEGTIQRRASKATIESAIGAKAKALDVFAAFLKNVPFTAYVSTGTGANRFRKPSTGMWTCMQKRLAPLSVDKENSFFVGDAAGRRGDHSDSDKKFAANLGIPFFTDDDYFASPVSSTSDPPLTLSTVVPRPIPKTTLLVLCGPPGAGKSTLASKLLEICESDAASRLCQDVMKTKDRVAAEARRLVTRAQESEVPRLIIIDRTNCSAEQRRTWVDIASEFQAECIAVWLESNTQECISRCCDRKGHEGGLFGPEKCDNIAKVVRKFARQIDFEQPSAKTEGFSYVIHLERYALSGIDAVARDLAGVLGFGKPHSN